MNKLDVSFKGEGVKFNFRVAGLFLRDNAMLLQKSAEDSYWSLIGGRVQLGETTINAIIREIKEETGILVEEKEVSLFKIVENFFTYNDIKFQELLFIFKINNSTFINMDNFKTLDKENVYNKWISFDEIKDLEILPEFIKRDYKNDNSTYLLINDIA